MQIEQNKVKLTELARFLGVSAENLHHCLTNGSGLGVGAEKAKGLQTGDWLLPIDSVRVYITWAHSKSRKITSAKLQELSQLLV